MAKKTPPKVNPEYEQACKFLRKNALNALKRIQDKDFLFLAACALENLALVETKTVPGERGAK